MYIPMPLSILFPFLVSNSLPARVFRDQHVCRRLDTWGNRFEPIEGMDRYTSDSMEGLIHWASFLSGPYDHKDCPGCPIPICFPTNGWDEAFYLLDRWEDTNLLGARLLY